MRTIRYTILLALAIVIAQAAFAQHKPKRHKGGIDSTNVLIHLSNCSVSSDGTIKNKNGEVVGKLTANGDVVNPASGQVIGKREETTEEKISKIYFNN